MLPTIEEIKGVILDPQNILVEELKGYCTKPGLLGPMQYSGGYCVVFPLTNGIKTKALRLWTKEIVGIKKRTQQVSSYIKSIPELPYFVKYEYYTNGVQFPNDKLYDVVVMDWVEGLSLKDYIEELLSSGQSSDKIKVELQILLCSFVRMFMDLNKYKISHGDFQHNNVIVKDAEHLLLIDYDSMYVPSMGAHVPQVTIGVSGYQHPLRKECKCCDERNDYFSELIIVTSLLALIEDISIWEDFDLCSDDFSLVFNASDFEDFEHSRVCRRLKNHSIVLDKMLNEVSIALTKRNLDELDSVETIIQRVGLNLKIPGTSYYCIQCGGGVSYGDIFCTNCGTKVIKK